MSLASVRVKKSGKVHLFAESLCLLMMGDCVQTFEITIEMPFRALRVGV
jgi:hypothetical protein